VHDQRVAAAAAAAKARAANRQIAALRAASSGGGLVALSTTAAATNTAPAASAGTGTELGSGGGASSNASTTTTAGTGDRASVVPKTALLPLTHLQANDLQQKELFANASSQEGANSLSTHHSWGPSESVGSPRLQPQRHTPLSNANLNNKGHGEGPQPDPEPSSERTSVRSVKTATTGGSHGGHAHGGAHEGAGPALACPSVESFSLGRVWASAHRSLRVREPIDCFSVPFLPFTSLSLLLVLFNSHISFCTSNSLYQAPWHTYQTFKLQCACLLRSFIFLSLSFQVGRIAASERRGPLLAAEAHSSRAAGSSSASTRGSFTSARRPSLLCVLHLANDA